MEPKRGRPGIQHLKPSRRFPNGGWLVRYRDPDNRTLRKTFELRQQALDFQASVRTDQRRGEYIDDREARTPFSEVADDWYATVAPRLRPKTKAGYASIMKVHLLPTLGRRPISRITAADIERLLGSLGVRAGTERNVLRVLNPIMKHAIKARMIKENPCSSVSARRSDGQEMHFLTPEQVRSLADEITLHYRTLILTAAYTGIRAGELAALRVRNVDLLHARVIVKESVADVGGQLHYGPTKNKKGRAVALPSFLVDLLVEQTAGKGPGDLVFTGPNGAPLRHGNYYQRHFKPAVRRALPEDLHDLRFHDLRHTAAAIMIDQKVHPKSISDRLGHSSIAITMDRYGHRFPNQEDDIAEALDAVFKGANPKPPAQATVVPIR